jgi:3-hydroxyisobutyrate dehydrogenase-like beta-hydroxyacid dehydrogenase
MPNTPLPRLGFIGLGIMGKPMATHLLKAGYTLTVFNRSKAGVNEMVALGATAAESPREVAERSDVVMTNLPDSPDVESVVIGRAEGGNLKPETPKLNPQVSSLTPHPSVLAGARPDSIIIDFSTISPTVSRQIAAALEKEGVHWLDAPVTGGSMGAQNATLTIMVGGRKEIFERCLPLFQCVGKKIVHVGHAGSGHTLKLVNQIICGIHLEALGEGLRIASRAGLDLKTTLDVISSGAANSWLISTWKDRILDGNFTPGFKSVHQNKDLRLALELAKELGIELPATEIVKKRFEELLARGDGDLGTHALVKLFLKQQG